MNNRTTEIIKVIIVKKRGKTCLFFKSTISKTLKHNLKIINAKKPHIY